MKKPLPRTGPAIWLAIVAAVGLRVFFWLYTDRRYEDGLITVTHAVNAANGLGLTHHPGEGHVFGFTSPVSVLVPLVGELVHPGSGFDALRWGSILAAAATIWLADRLACRLGLGTAGRVLVAGYLSVDYLQIFFGMAGMETQIGVAVLFAVALAVAEERFTLAGIALGLAVLTRPDFVLLGAAVLLALAMRRRWREAIRITALATAVVLPWTVFATLYYGSPVPHTIVAKSIAYTYWPPLDAGPSAWLSALGHHLSRQAEQVDALAPFGENFYVDAGAWTVIAKCLVVLAAFGAWRLRRQPAATMLIWFTLIYAIYLILADPLPYFRWYLPPVLAVIVMFAAAGLEALFARRRTLGVIASAMVVAAFALQVPVFFPIERTIQHGIEAKVREPLGIYLHRVVRPGESVFSESAGYVGYYGHVKLYDFPGLTSPTSSRALERLPFAERHPVNLAFTLKPDWLVLRPAEEAAVGNFAPGFDKRYRLVRRFSVPKDATSLSRFGVTVRNIDRDFAVFHVQKTKRAGPPRPALFSLVRTPVPPRGSENSPH